VKIKLLDRKGKRIGKKKKTSGKPKIGAPLTLFFKVTTSRLYDEALPLNLILFGLASENGEPESVLQ
jgi:hypothetical protein